MHVAGSDGAASGSSNGRYEAAERIASGSRASSSGSIISSPSSPKLQPLREIPWRSFFTNKAFIALILAHGSSGESGGWLGGEGLWWVLGCELDIIMRWRCME
jgi:hypothetical protein